MRIFPNYNENMSKVLSKILLEQNKKEKIKEQKSLIKEVKNE